MWALEGLVEHLRAQLAAAQPYVELHALRTGRVVSEVVLSVTPEEP